MKKITQIILVAVLLTTSYVASAQIYLGGSVSGAYTESPSTSSKSWAVDVSPEIGFAFSNRWAVGLRVSYGKSVSEVDSPYLNETKTSVNLFTVNPYFAYAPLRVNRFAVWAEVGVQFAPEQEHAEFNTFAGYITPVLTFDVTKHLTLKTNLGFAGLAVTGTTDGDIVLAGVIGGDDAITFNDDLSIGVVFRF